MYILSGTTNGGSSFAVPAIDSKDNKTRHLEYLINIIPLKEGKPCKDLIVSWFDHGIFKKIKYVYYSTRTKRFYLEVEKLYNKNKLRRLYNSESYKNQDYSFFNYAALEYLVNGKTEMKNGVCGLFK